MGRLLAAAVKRLITPSQEIFDASVKQGIFGFFDGKYEETYARVLVLADRDGHKTVLLAADIMSIPGQRALTKRISDTFGVDPLAVIYTCTHNHQGISIAMPGEAPRELLPTRPYQAEYLRCLHDGIIDALGEAFGSLREARMGVGSGLSCLNNNRDWPGLSGNIAASSLQASSNKELVVLKVDTLEGDPIALFVNYDLHATFLFGIQNAEGFIKSGGDIPGAISRYVENAIGRGCVVGWTFGAAGVSILIKMNTISRIMEANTISELQNLLLEIMDRVIEYQNDNHHTCVSEKLEQIEDYIRCHFNDYNLCIKQIAEKVNISVPYLSKVFCEKNDCGLLDYINLYRINKAKCMLLQQSDVDIRDIANQIGFSSCQTFIRVFKKYEGLTPGQFRDRHSDAKDSCMKTISVTESK